VANVLANEPVGVCLLIFGDPVEDAARIATEFKTGTRTQVVVVYLGGGELELQDKCKI
jgi:hypothetical protein